MKNIARVLFTSTILLTAVSANATLISSDSFGGTIYDVYSDSGISWEAASAFASSEGGHLVTITSGAEDTFVANLVQSAGLGEVWAGGQQIDHSSLAAEGWSLVTGEEFSYTNWSPNEPNDWNGKSEHYLGINWGSGKWNDERALGNIWGFVVEYYTIDPPAKIPEPSVIALFGLGLLGLGFARRRKA